MTAAHAVLLAVVVGGSGLCLLPGVPKNLGVSIGALMVALSTLVAALGLDETSSSLAEAAYYCVVIALLSAALAWTGQTIGAGVRRLSPGRVRGDPS